MGVSFLSSILRKYKKQTRHMACSATGHVASLHGRDCDDGLSLNKQLVQVDSVQSLFIAV
jgi:hypothetical protein